MSDEVCHFHTRFQQSCPIMVETLRDLIRKDTENGTLVLRHYSKYQIAIPSLNGLEHEFNRAFRLAVFDIDMREDLERSEVINWCRTTKLLQVLKTTADGNCLLHAISQALWGIEDSTNFLRQLIYCKISVDTNGQFNKRWLLHQQSFIQTMHEELRMNTQEFNVEWESVIKATNDSTTPDAHGLPYRTLESIHLFVAANALKRPIIVLADSIARNVYGQSLQENPIGGIYLPLDTPHQQCHKSPLVIGYSLNHFAPLVFELDKARDSVEMFAVPIVSKKFEMLECKFLLPHEEAESDKLLRNYLNLKEVVFDGVMIPAAVVNHSPLPDTVNIVEAYKKNCEEKFRRMTGRAVGLSATGQKPNPTVNVAPVHNTEHKPGTLGPQGVQDPPSKKCLSVGCKKTADPAMNGFCSSCFNVFTVQYAKQEEARRRSSARAPPVQPGFQRVESNRVPVEPLRRSQQTQSGKTSPPDYYDLSMLGEDCKAKCGFKCAVNTYPYCHECYPKYVKKDTPAAERVDEWSLMPDTCCAPGCSFKCSKATHPYCHQCFQKLNKLHASRPTAPPNSMELHSTRNEVSVPEKPLSAPCSSYVSLKMKRVIYPQQEYGQPLAPYSKPIETASQRCKTLGCVNKADPGSDGYCEYCYQLCLFEPNVPPSPKTPELSFPLCPTPNCNNPVLMSDLQMCTNCYIAIAEPSGQIDMSAKMNIVPPVENKILNQTPEDQNLHYSSGEQMRSVPAEHDETELPKNQLINLSLVDQQQKYDKYSAHVKHICATPGCNGLRTETSDLCHSCEMHEYRNQEGNIVQEESEQFSEPMPSASPALSEEEIRRLNPIVLSSKDKIKCSYPSCKNMIYPPKKLCDGCTADLDRVNSERSKKESKAQAMTENLANQMCKTQGCQFYGTAEFGGYCSSCHKGMAKSSKYDTVPLFSNKKPTNDTRLHKTEPLAKLTQGKPCIEKGCQRYGDPAQDFRCSQHYVEARRFAPKTSDQSLKNLLQAINPSQRPAYMNGNETSRLLNIQGQRPLNLTVNNTGPTENQNGTVNDDQFLQSYGKLESSRKSKERCRNREIIGCHNYGNSKTEGYCNTCYTNLKRVEHLRRK